jgi:hypothetical protein
MLGEGIERKPGLHHFGQLPSANKDKIKCESDKVAKEEKNGEQN